MTWKRFAAGLARRTRTLRAMAVFAAVLFVLRCVSWLMRRTRVANSTFLSSLAKIPRRGW